MLANRAHVVVRTRRAVGQITALSARARVVRTQVLVVAILHLAAETRSANTRVAKCARIPVRAKEAIRIGSRAPAAWIATVDGARIAVVTLHGLGPDTTTGRAVFAARAKIVVGTSRAIGHVCANTAISTTVVGADFPIVAVFRAAGRARAVGTHIAHGARFAIAARNSLQCSGRAAGAGVAGIARARVGVIALERLRAKAPAACAVLAKGANVPVGACCRVGQVRAFVCLATVVRAGIRIIAVARFALGTASARTRIFQRACVPITARQAIFRAENTAFQLAARVDRARIAVVAFDLAARRASLVDASVARRARIPIAARRDRRQVHAAFSRHAVIRRARRTIDAE